MPRFAVLIEGSNIEFRSESGTFVGFFTTRYVWASDGLSAGTEAKRRVRAEWLAREDSFKEGVSSLNLNADEVGRLSVLKTLFLRGNGGGYTFYKDEE